MKPSIEDRVLSRLRGFTEALKAKDVHSRFTVRRIKLDLKPTSYTPELVKETRRLLGVSQAVFAKLLGAKVKTVSAWEQGVNPPHPIACRFMDEMRRQPEYWINRLRESAASV